MCGDPWRVRMISLCSIYAPVFTIPLESGGIRELSCELSMHFTVQYHIDCVQYYSPSYYMQVGISSI